MEGEGNGKARQGRKEKKVKGKGSEREKEIKLKNGRVGKEIKLLATLYTPGGRISIAIARIIILVYAASYAYICWKMKF